MEYKLEDVVEIYNKKRIPLSKMERDVQESRTYPYYGAQGIIDYVEDFIFDGKYLLIAEDGENLRSRNEDVARIVEGKFWVNNHAHILKSNNQANLYYLKDLINLKDLQPYLSGSVQPKLNLKSLKSIKVDLPNINVQNKIASFINRLDEKVTTNNKIIANLEELSQTLFKRWFIDFEFPDVNGNPYKSSGGKFMTSELGAIPEDWHIKKLDEIATHKKESFNPQKEVAQTVAHFSLPAFDTNQMPVLDYSKDIRSNKWLISEDSILFSKMNPKTVRVWLPSIYKDLTNVASTEFVVLESKDESVRSLIYNLVSSNIFTNFLLSNATGSTNSRQRVKPNIAVSFKLALNEQTIKLYGQHINPLMRKIISLREENLYLNEMRDTLLPKLMSGELELPEELEV